MESSDREESQSSDTFLTIIRSFGGVIASHLVVASIFGGIAVVGGIEVVGIKIEIGVNRTSSAPTTPAQSPATEQALTTYVSTGSGAAEVDEATQVTHRILHCNPCDINDMKILKHSDTKQTIKTDSQIGKGNLVIAASESRLSQETTWVEYVVVVRRNTELLQVAINQDDFSKLVPIFRARLGVK